MVVEPATIDAGVTVESSDGLAGEECGADVANQAADAVHGEDVKGVVDAKEELDLGGIVGEGSSEDTEDDSRPSGDVSYSKLANDLNIHVQSSPCTYQIQG